MTWGDIQIESLKKMFLNNDELRTDNLNDYKSEKRYKTYLYAMPQACNEAINYITSRLGTTEVLNELEKGDTNYYDLSSIFGDFRMLKGLFADIPISWKTINKNVVYIDNWESGKIMASYEVKPAIITSSTSDSHEIELLPEYANLIPLYVAGELYKDDDLTLATMYMNEFMTLVNNYADNPYGVPTPTIERIYSIGG